jgi:hypothetical protein
MLFGATIATRWLDRAMAPVDPLIGSSRYMADEKSVPYPIPQFCNTRKSMIRKLKSGQYRLYSRKANPKTGKRRNLGTFDTRRAAEQHEREVQFFKRRG